MFKIFFEFFEIDFTIAIFVEFVEYVFQIADVVLDVLVDEEVFEFHELDWAGTVFVHDVEHEFGGHEHVGFLQGVAARDELGVLDGPVVVQVDAVDHHFGLHLVELEHLHHLAELLLVQDAVVVVVEAQELLLEFGEWTAFLDFAHAVFDGLREYVHLLEGLQLSHDRLLVRDFDFGGGVGQHPRVLQNVLEWDAVVRLLDKNQLHELHTVLRTVFEVVVVLIYVPLEDGRNYLFVVFPGEGRSSSKHHIQQNT